MLRYLGYVNHNFAFQRTKKVFQPCQILLNLNHFQVNRARFLQYGIFDLEMCMAMNAAGVGLLLKWKISIYLVQGV